MNLAELLTVPASMFPDQEILRFEGQRTTYGALAARVARTAGALRELGLAAGDRVAVLETNTPSVVETLFACASVGAVFVPLNFRARVDELTHMLAVSAPRLLLAGERYLALAREAVTGRAVETELLSLEPTLSDARGLPLLAERAEPLEPQEVSDDDLAVVLFTSGTTAAPKGVMLAHADLVNFVFATTEPADGSNRGSVLLAAPIYHVAGLSAVLTAAFSGRRIVLMRQFQAEAWLRLVEEERVTHAFLVPTMLKRVLDSPAFAEADLSSLQVLSYGAAPMPLSVIRRAIEAFPRTVQFINAFGQTETSSTVCMLGPEDHRLEGSPEEVERRLRRLSSIGRPLEGVEIGILDELGNPLPRGAVGELAVRADRVMRGYLGQEEATRATLRGGWLLTRDLAWMDEDGYVYLAGRKSDMIIRGGENIAPPEVEAVLESHPAVEEAAVFGVPDEEWGERVAAVVVPKPGAQVTTEELIAFCRQRLASFKKPEIVQFVSELPRNPMGKVLRRDLRVMLSGAAPR